MQVESVLALREELFTGGLTGLLPNVMSGMEAGERSAVEVAPFPLALGVTGTPGRDDARLAVRAWKRNAETDALVRALRERSSGEIDVAFTGRIVALDEELPLRGPTRPLLLGSSCAHSRDHGFGTLGCFVRREGQNYLLSNNHVLARENLAKLNQEILQPAFADDGRKPADVVGVLTKFVELVDEHNTVDAAIAGPLTQPFDSSEILGLGPLGGLRAEPLVTDNRVSKLGRTTGLTHGRVRAWDLMAVKIQYGSGRDRWFDHQLEIVPQDSMPFSNGGDSGSLVVDDQRMAAGLLFGGSGGFTYANQIDRVLAALGATLLT